MPRRDQVHALAAWTRGMPVAPYFLGPVHDIAAGIQIGADRYDHRGAIGLPRELVLAHPLHPHRPARHGTRQESGIERHVIGAVVTVATRAIDVGEHDVLFGHLQRPRKMDPQRVDALAMRPYVVASVL